jgi:general secretion pathway protein E/type IV pilus assembly protein PilB
VETPFLENIGFPLDRLSEGAICEPVGCEECRGTGYAGRTGIYEILLVSDAIRQMIVERRSAADIKMDALEHGMRTLRMDGWRKVLGGVTTLEEVLRVTSEDEA